MMVGSWKHKIEGSQFSLGKKKKKARTSLQRTRAKKAGGVTQVVGLPPSKYKALSSNPRTASPIIKTLLGDIIHSLLLEKKVVV
jgi:hypothetical protein